MTAPLMPLEMMVEKPSWIVTLAKANSSKLYLSLLFCVAASTVAAAGTSHSISIATYNVENLFDTEDDPQSLDHTFLPLNKKKTKSHETSCQQFKRDSWIKECLELDWSESVLESKLSSVASVLQEMNADVVILQEVETLQLLKRLARLTRDYHEQTLLKGPDARGIQIGVLSRFPPMKSPSPQLHLDPSQTAPQPKTPNDFRGIFETHWRLPNGDRLIVLGLHLPAPHHPTQARKNAILHLNSLQENLKKQFKDNTLIIAGGDFNIPSQVKEEMDLYSLLRPLWLLPHETPHLLPCPGCNGTVHFIPPEERHLKSAPGIWSYFDILLLKLNPNWEIAGSEVFSKAPEQLNAQQRPARFDPLKKKGVSDHLPFKVTLKQKRPS